MKVDPALATTRSMHEVAASSSRLEECDTAVAA
jgi:hypothetical protein